MNLRALLAMLMYGAGIKPEVFVRTGSYVLQDNANAFARERKCS